MVGHFLPSKPVFHFRVFSNEQELHESDPLTFDDLKGVWREGAMSACEIIYGMRGRIEDELDWRLEATDAAGAVIYRFSFKAETLCDPGAAKGT